MMESTITSYTTMCTHTIEFNMNTEKEVKKISTSIRSKDTYKIRKKFQKIKFLRSKRSKILTRNKLECELT